MDKTYLDDVIGLLFWRNIPSLSLPFVSLLFVTRVPPARPAKVKL